MYTKIAYQTWSFRIKTHQQKAKKSRVSSVAEPSWTVSDQNPEAHKLICGVRVGGLTGTILISGLSLRMTMYTYAVKTNITLPQYTFMNDSILNSAKKPPSFQEKWDFVAIRLLLMLCILGKYFAGFCSIEGLGNGD